MHRVLRDLPSLAVASVQPVLFVLLFRDAADSVVWTGVSLVALASIYFGVRLAGPAPEATPDRLPPKARRSP